MAAFLLYFSDNNNLSLTIIYTDYSASKPDDRINSSKEGMIGYEQ